MGLRSAECGKLLLHVEREGAVWVFHVEHSAADGFEEDGGVGVRDEDGCLRGEIGRKNGWGTGEEEQLVGGAGCCNSYGDGHIVYGA